MRHVAPFGSDLRGLGEDEFHRVGEIHPIVRAFDADAPQGALKRQQVPGVHVSRGAVPDDGIAEPGQQATDAPKQGREAAFCGARETRPGHPQRSGGVNEAHGNAETGIDEADAAHRQAPAVDAVHRKLLERESRGGIPLLRREDESITQRSIAKPSTTQRSIPQPNTV